jgi:O-antigen ligase
MTVTDTDNVPMNLENAAARNKRMADVNNIFTFGFFLFSALVGSVSSACLAAATALGFFRVAAGHIKPLENRQIRLVAFAFLLYPLAELISIIVNQRGIAGFIELGGAALFASVLPVASRLCLSSPQNIFGTAARGAASAGVVLVIYCLIELFVWHFERPEAGLGNPNVLAVFALIVCCICLSLVSIVDAGIRKWIYFGAFCAFSALLMSGTRAAWLAAPFAIIAAALPLRGFKFKKPSIQNMVLLSFAAGLVMIIAATIVFDRISATIGGLQQGVTSADDYASIAISQRLFMWKGGFEQFKSSWLFGYGPDSAAEMMAALGGNPPFTFTHYHNFLLTAAIRGGVIEVIALVLVLASLIWFAVQKSYNQTQRAGRALVASVTVSGFLPGMVGILFTHDVVNAVFLYTIIIGLCLGVAGSAKSPDPT